MYRIPLTSDALARSRFAISPAQEVTGTLKARRSGHPHAHVRARLAAAGRCAPRHRVLLEGLVEPRHPYVPDFLTPVLPTATADIADVVETIARTPPEIVSYHLDISFRGRRVWPEVEASIGTPEAYEAWRREMPPAVQRAAAGGPGAFARACADAIGAWFRAAVAPEWSRTLDVLHADVAYRAEQQAALGARGLFADLCPGVHWHDGEVRIDGPFDVPVDWASDGIVLIPSTVQPARVSVAAERPDPPQLVYPARGIAALWPSPAVASDATPVAELLGATRAAILAQIVAPRCTQDLAHQLDLAPATVSFHLGVLYRSGLARRWRSGSRVWYEASELGMRLRS